MSSFSGALCVAAALSLSSLHANAAEGAPGDARVPLRLEVEADAACMSDALVKERILARSGRVELLPAGAPAQTAPAARARVTQRVPEASAAHGEFAVLLELESRDGRLTKRELRVRDCKEANDAAALIVVLWLDEAEPAAPPDQSAVSAPEPAQSLAPAPAVDEGESPAHETQAREGAGGFRFSVGVLGQGSLGPAPGPLLGPALLFTAAYAEYAILSPALRLTAAYEVALSETRADGGTAQFSLGSASLDACPLRLGSEEVAVRPCATAVFGALHASGEDTLEPESATRPYYALGGSLVGTGELSSGFGLVLRAAVAFPLSRDRFEFEPIVFHEVPAVVGTADLGVSYRFP